MCFFCITPRKGGLGVVYGVWVATDAVGEVKECSYLVLSRDPCKNRQDGLGKIAVYGFQRFLYQNKICW